MNFIYTVDAAPEGYEGNVGLVTQYIPQLPLKDFDNAIAVVVGPPMMIKFSIQELLKIGFDEEKIWLSESRKMCCGSVNAVTAASVSSTSARTDRYSNTRPFAHLSTRR